MVSAIEAILSKLLDKPLINQFISTRKKGSLPPTTSGVFFFQFFPNAKFVKMKYSTFRARIGKKKKNYLCFSFVPEDEKEIQLMRRQ